VSIIIFPFQTFLQKHRAEAKLNLFDMKSIAQFFSGNLISSLFGKLVHIDLNLYHQITYSFSPERIHQLPNGSRWLFHIVRRYCELLNMYVCAISAA
jgi:hypothetical protein